jgi:hypothetical protein
MTAENKNKVVIFLFFRRFFNRVFGRFTTGGFKKRDKKNRGNFPQPQKKVPTYLPQFYFLLPPI